MKLLAIFRRFWLAIIIAAVLLLLINDKELLAEIGIGIAKIDPRIFPALFAIQVLLWTIQAFAWKETIRGFHLPAPTFLRSISHLSALVVGKYIPGKVWGMAARGGDMVANGINTKEAFKITLYEQILIVVAASMVFLIGASLSLDLLFPSVLLVFFLLISLSVLFKLTVRFYRKIYRLASTEKQPESKATDLVRGKRFFLQWITALHSLAWTLQGLIAVLLAHGIGLNVTGNIGNIVAAHAASSVMGFIAIFAPGGLGVREASFISILSVSYELHAIAAVAVMLRIWTVAADLALGVIGAVTFTLQSPSGPDSKKKG